MRLRKVILFRHVLVWVLYFSYELLLIQITIGSISPLWHFFVYYLINVGLFYFNAHGILDFAFCKTRRPYLVAILLVFVEMVVFIAFKIVVDHWLTGSPVDFSISPVHTKLWLANLFRELFFIGFSIAYWSMLYMLRYQEANHAMEKEKLRDMAKTLELENKYISAENAYLQNQISPHLLFNTLNFIYNSIHKLSERAGNGVMLLSEIMRYSLISSVDQATVSLRLEVEQIDKLIALTQLRFDQELFIRFTKKGSLKDRLILPLLLVTLVENMIKHGDIGEAKTPGLIRLTIENDQLHFETRNKIRNSSPHPASGIGLANIGKRLNNFYPNRHQLAINTSNDEFVVHLNLTL